MNKILSFDASNNSCSASISVGQNVIAFAEEKTPSMQAERLLPMIEQILALVDLSYFDLDYVITTKGPGSFTGIKIGLAVATAIKMATTAKILAISNFDVSFFKLKDQIKSFSKAVIILNAYRNQCYLQEFDALGFASPAILINNDDILQYLSELRHNSNEQDVISCAGSGIEYIYNNVMDLNITILPRFTKIKSLYISKSSDYIINNHSAYSNINGFYVRPPDAKIPTII